MGVCVANQFNIWLILEPAVIKICIGIEQIMVVAEITLKVRENQKYINKAQTTPHKTKNGRDKMNELVASQKKVVKCVRIIQICGTIFIAVVLIGSLAIFIFKDE